MVSLLSVRWLAVAAGLGLAFAGSLRAQDGFAREVTGGQGGETTVVRDAETFRRLAGDTAPSRILQVAGRLNVGEVYVSSNRTIVGVGQGAALQGDLILNRKIRNVIIQNLDLSNPLGKAGDTGEDGITLRGAQSVWIDHCTVHDTPDGLIDMTHGVDKVTISWCKFYYSTGNREHRFTMLVIGAEKDKKADIKKDRVLRITLHHNWWAENCDERMPAARLAKVHMYNNYFSCVGNSYCTNARPLTELLSQSNYYDGVKNPCYKEGDSRLRTENNIFNGCKGKIENRSDEVFEPPYNYQVDPVKQVPEIVRRGAGAGRR